MTKNDTQRQPGQPDPFDPPISTSNLVRPEFERFLDYSRKFYEAKRYSNNGVLVTELEKRLAHFHDTAFCICLSSGFWALVLTIKEIALGDRDEVVIPSLTYRRLADVVNWAGFTPRFCDIDPRTLAMSYETVSEVVSGDTALILGVHPVINTCDIRGLESLSTETSIPLIFDSVESPYETVDGKRVGSFGRAEVFSMHASKLINGFEGGYVTTNDSSIAKRLSLSRGFGFAGQDQVVMHGFNAKLNEIHAAMALSSLDDLEIQVKRNKARFYKYKERLIDIEGLNLVHFNESEKTSFKNVLVELTEAWPASRDQTIDYLNANGILARAYYSPSLHCKSRSFETRFSRLPVTKMLEQHYMLLPTGDHVGLQDIERIIEHLIAFRYQVTTSSRSGLV